MMFSLLFIYMSCNVDEQIDSNDEQIESVNQDDMPNYKQIAQYIIGVEDQTSSKSLNKENNNGNGVYFVPFISNDKTNWTLAWLVPNTSLVMYVEYPQNGNDRLLIFSGEEMMVNWSTQEPRLFMVDLADGIVKYSNWCDENKLGFYHFNGKSTWYPIDINGDGETDIYGWNASTLDKNFNIVLKTTLTDSQISDTWIYPVQGECRSATENVEFNYHSQSRNGAFTETATFN